MLSASYALSGPDLELAQKWPNFWQL